MRFALIACVAGLLATTGAAKAQLAVCTLSPGPNGEIALGADLRSWRTTVPSTISVVNVLPARIFIERPLSWSFSPAQTPATTFFVTATLSGANSGTVPVAGGVASSTLPLVGTTVASVSLGADAGAPFVAGSYSAQVTVTCTGT